MKSIVLIVLALLLAAPAIADEVTAFSVQVPATGSTVTRLKDTHTSIRLSAPTTGLSARLYRLRSNSSGTATLIASSPPDSGMTYAMFDNHAVPAPGDTTLALMSVTVQAWNTYNGVVVDLLVLHNSGGSPQTVDVEVWK